MLKLFTATEHILFGFLIFLNFHLLSNREVIICIKQSVHFGFILTLSKTAKYCYIFSVIVKLLNLTTVHADYSGGPQQQSAHCSIILGMGDSTNYR